MRRPHVLTATAALITLALVAAHLYMLDGLDGLFWSSGFAEDTVYAPGYTDHAFRSVRVGMSTQEVRALLGAPLEAHTPYQGRSAPDWDLGWRWSRSAHDSSYRCRVILFRRGVVIEKISEFYVD